jgi:hypothetical protein
MSILSDDAIRHHLGKRSDHQQFNTEDGLQDLQDATSAEHASRQ